MTKACKQCGIEKSLEEFSRQKLGRLGRRSRCKPCIALEAADYRSRTVERRASYNKHYRAENREKHLAYNTAWNQAHRDVCDAATAAWRKRNPDKLAAQKARRRALDRRVPGAEYATTEKVRDRLAFFDGCYYCGGQADTIDHRIPVSRGGTHLPANLVPACRSCNSRKINKTELEYRAWRGVSPVPHG